MSGNSDGTPGERLTLLVAETLRIAPGSVVDALDMDGAETWDSLTHMELIAAIEDSFGLELNADDIVAMTSIGRIRAIVLPKVSAR